MHTHTHTLTHSHTQTYLNTICALSVTELCAILGASRGLPAYGKSKRANLHFPYFARVMGRMQGTIWSVDEGCVSERAGCQLENKQGNTYGVFCICGESSQAAPAEQFFTAMVLSLPPPLFSALLNNP